MAFEHARAQAVEQHVGLSGQGQCLRAVGRIGQVQRQAGLAGVERHEGGQALAAAHDVAAVAVLDLEYLGAQSSQVEGRQEDEVLLVFGQRPFGQRDGELRRHVAEPVAAVLAGDAQYDLAVGDFDDGDRRAADRDFIERMILYEDDEVVVLNKPFGIAVQGGTGTKRHIDGILAGMADRFGDRPRLVHRLDRDTTGVLVVARTRGAAQALTAAFRERDTKKTYWSLVKGVPRPAEGKVSTWLVKEQTPDGDRMRIAKHGEDGADHAVSYYRVIEQAGQNLAWLEMEPYTGRTHQLRVHAAHLGHPIIGDPKYFEAEQSWTFPGGVQNKLHLHARHIDVPHPDGGRLRVTAPLPPHMVQTWNLMGFDEQSGGDFEE